MNAETSHPSLPLVLGCLKTELSLTKKIALVLVMACITGLMAQVRVPLPFTPVPMTGQTFAVLMAGVVLGRNWGGVSQALYATLGFAGIPWFSGMAGGLTVLTGPTAGYILGFILAALFIGYVVEKYPQSKKFSSLLSLMLFATFVLIFIPGLLHLALWMSLVKGSQVSVMAILSMGLFPFMVDGILKAVLAASISCGLMRLGM